MNYSLNIFFFVFHTIFILFNILGWIWKKTRLLNLITLLLTGGSWFILGIWYGMGYCPCTDWHWQLRENMNYSDMPASYIKFLIDSMTGLNVNATLVDIGTLIFFLAALIISLILNILDFKKAKE